MAQKKKISGKYRTRKVTDKQDKEITKLQKEKGLGTYLEAKHIYFSQLEDPANNIASSVNDEIENDIAEARKARKSMTIGETKLGITMVISKEEAKKMNIPETMTTSQAIHEIKVRLGIKV